LANELVHLTSDRTSAGTLTQAEFDSVTAHSLNNQATGDIIYAPGSSGALNRLGIGSANQHLAVSTGGIPEWVTPSDITLNPAVADENVSGIKASFTAGEALSRGEVVYFKASDSKMWKAVATATGTMPVVAMAAADIGADAAGLFLLQGFCQDNGTFPAYTVGGRLYAPEAETVGENVPEQAQPDSDGDFVQDLGWAVTANTVYFKPGETVVEIA